MAAEVAERLGIDPAPFRKQAEKIKQAVDEILWLPEKGIYAEYKDALGLERLHESPELPSIYHPIDFYLTDDFQAYQMLRFTEYRLKNEHQTPRGGRLIWSSDWEPPLYSSHGLYPQEVLNTLLCYYRIGQTEEAQKLLNGCVASWYMGPVPGGIAHNIRPNGEHFGSTDFSDTVSTFCRSIVEGLFGILPRMQDHTITIMPGFPRRWERARISTPDITCEYERQGLQEIVRATTSAPTEKTLKLIARWDKVRQVQVNGQDADFAIVPGIGQAYVVVKAPLSTTVEIVIRYRRTKSAQLTFSPAVPDCQWEDRGAIRRWDPAGAGFGESAEFRRPDHRTLPPRGHNGDHRQQHPCDRPRYGFTPEQGRSGIGAVSALQRGARRAFGSDAIGMKSRRIFGDVPAAADLVAERLPLLSNS